MAFMSWPTPVSVVTPFPFSSPLDTDPALSDSGLARKLRTNREVAISSLEEVITKFAMKQGDTEEEERKKRQKANQKKEVRKRSRELACCFKVFG